MHTTHDSLSSSRAPPATAVDCWLPPDDASNGFGCTKVPPEGLVSKPVELARAGGAAASCPVPHEGIGGADDAAPLLGANGLPAYEQGVHTCKASRFVAHMVVHEAKHTLVCFHQEAVFMKLGNDCCCINSNLHED